MNNRMTEQQLEDRLRTEAAQESPPFSDELHQRIITALTQAPARPQHTNWLPAAVAAGLLIAAGVFFHLNKPGSVPNANRSIARALPSVPPIENPVHVLDQQTTDSARYAYLDRDGTRLLDYMARQVDVMPDRQ